MNAIGKTANLPAGARFNERGVPAVSERAKNPSLYAIWSVLHWTYGLVPIVAGLDKFTNVLTHWENYLNPALMRMLPISSSVFMGAVGVVEMIAGILVFARPRIGGTVVAAWLVAIALSLITSRNFFDVAVRDLVMAIGAYTMVRLTPLAEAVTDAKE